MLPTQDDNQLTIEILVYKQQAAANIIEIGKRLAQVKEILPHGEWEKWLDEKVEFSKERAKQFIKIANECSNSISMWYIYPTKVFALLDIPKEERKQFVQRPIEIPSGEVKTVDQMTKYKLPEILTAQNIADYLSISRRVVYELFQRFPSAGGIPNFDIGSSRRVEKKDFIKWIEARKGEKAQGVVG